MKISNNAYPTAPGNTMESKQLVTETIGFVLLGIIAIASVFYGLGHLINFIATIAGFSELVTGGVATLIFSFYTTFSFIAYEQYKEER